MFSKLMERENGLSSVCMFANYVSSPGGSVIRSLHRHSELEGHDGCVNTLAFTPDGTRLISGSDDLKIKIWDWEAGGPDN
jgi:WD40 repeat protein